MKKILLVTEVFPPAFNPRMGYLVKYLPDHGWSADIVTQNAPKDNNFTYLEGNNKPVRINLRDTGTPKGFASKLRYLLNLRSRYDNNKKAFVDVIGKNFERREYSLILVSVSWDLFVLEAAIIIAKSWKIPILVDLRDIIEQKPANQLIHLSGIRSVLVSYLRESFMKEILNRRNRALRYVQGITTVSPYHVAKLKCYNLNVRLIYNGFDPDLFHPTRLEPTDCFSIIYTGLVFENEQDPTLLFEAVRKLEQDAIISTKNFKIQFYTPERYRSAIKNNRMYPSIKKYVVFFDYVDYIQVPMILCKASIALVLSNSSHENGPKGVLTTKLFDYLGMERPVLCVRSDEGLLEQTIRDAKIGVAARTVDDAQKFILEKLKEWELYGYTTAQVNMEYKRQFSRKNQARQFADFFNEVILA